MAALSQVFRNAYRLKRHPAPHRRALAWHYILMQLAYSLYYRYAKSQPKSWRALGMEFHFFKFRPFLDLFEDIFITQPYYFETQNKAPVILDCGANIGLATLYFKKLFPASRITAFEPDPKTHAMLQKNIAANNFQNVTAVQAALSDNTGPAGFYADPHDPGNFCQSLDAARMKGEKIEVQGVKLSDYMPGEVDYLKLDVEGAEDKVLQDLISSGKIKNIKRFFIEYHHHIDKSRDDFGAFLKLLEDNGFGYQLDAKAVAHKTGTYQDILIFGWRKAGL